MEYTRKAQSRPLAAAHATGPRLRPGRKLLAASLPGVFPLLVIAIGAGLWRALERTGGVSSAQRVTLWLVVVVPLAVWLLVVSLLAGRGVYRRAKLALPLGTLLPPVIGLLLLTRLPHGPQLLHAIPRSWLIALMVIRLVGGVFLVVWAAGEVARPWFSVSAGGLDVLIGATALPLAFWVSSGAQTAQTTAIAWNLLGLLDFAIAIGLGRRFPDSGPNYLVSASKPTVAALRPTTVGIFTYGVPLAIMVHVLSLWQLLAG